MRNRVINNYFMRGHMNIFSSKFSKRFGRTEISSSFGMSLKLMNWSNCGDPGRFVMNIHLGWPNVFITLPVPPRVPKDDFGDSWGFSIDRDNWSSIHIGLGAKTKVIDLPWALEHYRTSYLASDGRTWLTDLAWTFIRHDKPPLGSSTISWFSWRDLPLWKKEIPYRYVLRSGEVQNVIATISVREYEWRRKWLFWLPLFRKVNRSIDVEFSSGVGEGAGSWKGGVLGTGWTMEGDETPEECLYRMQDNAKFGR